MESRSDLFDRDTSAGPLLVGMVHLAPLPGSPRFAGDLQAVVDAALRDAAALAEGGFDALIVENFGDAPFTRGRVEAVTVAAITRTATELRREVALPIGINVLRNDGVSALAIAGATGAAVVRINVLAGARLTDQGLIEGDAYAVMRQRAAVAPHCAVWADIRVKHSAPLAELELRDEVSDLVERAHADAVIVSGAGTGARVDDQLLERVAALSRVPVLVGSGADLESIRRARAHARGFIVGTSLKEGGIHSPVSLERVRRFVAAARGG